MHCGGECMTQGLIGQQPVHDAGICVRSRTIESEVRRRISQQYRDAGTLLTAELALARGLACNTAGGTHHAFPGHGSGFCILNDLAYTAQVRGQGWGSG